MTPARQEPPHLPARPVRRVAGSLALLLGLGAPPLAVAVGSTDEPAAEPADRGRNLYLSHCMRCHGPNMVTPGTIAYDLRKFPADQKDRFVVSVLNGRGAMPAWGGLLAGADLDALWAYVLTRGR